MIDLDRFIERLRALGEATRLRLLALLRQGDLSVGELVDILGQSQPSISQHLKVLTASGLVERLPEGSWVYYRASREGVAEQLIVSLLAFVDLNAAEFVRDRDRLARVRAARSETANAYFDRIAASWDTLRALHYPEEAIEAALLEAAGPGPFGRVIDIGTGTGRMLSLFSPRAETVEGIDRSHEMLTVARANLQRDRVTNALVRQGEATALPFADASADLVVIHQVLHFVEHPSRVIEEAARVMRPGGRLVIADFAPHGLEFLRGRHAHRHLGLSPDALEAWAQGTGLKPVARRLFDPPEGENGGLSVQIMTADKAAKAEEQAA